MSLEMFDLLWNIPIWVTIIGMCWSIWTRRGEPIFMSYPWYVAAGLAWLVDSGIEYVEDSIWWAVAAGVLAVWNLLLGLVYHDMKVDHDRKIQERREKAGLFEKFRIDDQK